MLEVLGLFGEVEWAGFNLNQEDGLRTLPVIVWRFVDGSDRQAQALQRELLDVMTADWVLENRDRNWVLWPSALAREFGKGGVGRPRPMRHRLWRLPIQLQQLDARTSSGG